MEEYWKKVHDDALAGMRGILDGWRGVEDTCEGMEEALACVMRHGSGREKADAIRLFGDYMWAAHERAAHDAAKPKM